jgi:ribonuclease VapC
MIVVDTSALVAILEREKEAAAFALAIIRADPPLISAATLLELKIVVVNRRGVRSLEAADDFIREADFRIEDVTARQIEIATDAYLRYGRGRSPARLNYSDCFSYALAKATGSPLLFKGGDFAKTDVAAVPLDV